LLLDLGHTGTIEALYQFGTTVFSADSDGRWIIWNATAGLQVASGLASAYPPTEENSYQVAGSIFLLQPAGEVRSLIDGSLLAIIPSASGLATDGSYVRSAATTGLTVWSPTGTELFSWAGDYGFPIPYGTVAITPNAVADANRAGPGGCRRDRVLRGARRRREHASVRRGVCDVLVRRREFLHHRAARRRLDVCEPACR
jgi:hypothetical protein